MSVQPWATASGGRSVSFSQSRLGECAQVAAGVAWVSRAVLTMPVAMPALSASCSQVSRCLPRLPAQSSRSPAETPMAPMWVFTPVVTAVMVPAESGVCESVL